MKNPHYAGFHKFPIKIMTNFLPIGVYSTFIGTEVVLNRAKLVFYLESRKSKGCFEYDKEQKLYLGDLKY